MEMGDRGRLRAPYAFIRFIKRDGEVGYRASTWLQSSEQQRSSATTARSAGPPAGPTSYA